MPRSTHGHVSLTATYHSRPRVTGGAPESVVEGHWRVRLDPERHALRQVIAARVRQVWRSHPTVHLTEEIPDAHFAIPRTMEGNRVERSAKVECFVGRLAWEEALEARGESWAVSDGR